MTEKLHIIGAGLAGSEAAWQAAQAGVPVVLHEMRPGRGTEAHKTGGRIDAIRVGGASVVMSEGTMSLR